MSKLFSTRRPLRTECFFCQSIVEPEDPRNFECTRCKCWNRYDSNNEIISDMPEMHDETQNTKSYALRGTSRTDRLPPSFGKGQFCHTCQTNQMLLANLLSNYLPPPEDPEYASRLETFPTYRESVEIRYPPVCPQCLPAVEDEIRKRDQMAKTTALGGFLKDSRGKGRQRQVSLTHARKEQLEKSLLMWRIRGVLYALTLAISLSTYTFVLAGYRILQIPPVILPTLPIFAFMSILWTAWNPTYATVLRDQLQGRTVRQKGKKEYNILQTVSWFSRLVTSIILSIPYFKPKWQDIILHNPPNQSVKIYCCTILFLELSVLICSIFVLRIKRPPPVQLLDTHSRIPSRLSIGPPSTSRGATPLTEPELLMSLSISGQPVQPSKEPINPIFGKPSLRSGVAMPTTGSDEKDPDAMDWSPTSSPVKLPSIDSYRKRPAPLAAEGSWIRQQTFFAPEEPTGLESLFANTIKLADGDDIFKKDGKRRGASTKSSGTTGSRNRSMVKWLLLSFVVLLPIIGGVGYFYWRQHRKIEVQTGATSSNVSPEINQS
ncbi:Ima1 N-terminal domain-containing protein [Abortiporus biennis]|nr:Ima1 N-terminal domain-containing protein [Abortiporus biennis]